ncbi:serine/threonine protein kinase [Nostoc sp. CENA67]|uniref:Serine/threonine protein kinase n=1 Tax=Amazonocrinis nigriterrae CENA67 TaxID=2794033 RepID=A0A8J7LAK9_9NOST|nr:serine/threonine-protein kinase [Amazonocrinis nigriterrae]MBH8564226.1 serine/threonine protein kinase [Amazonocrinis nigriterrae CENA67]
MADQSLNDFNRQILQQRYEIQQQLGKKAGRRTVLAHDLETQQLVIIKLLTFSSDFAWEDLKLFEREAETLKAIDHPAIPRYLDYFELDASSNRGYALVQSYVKGKSLEEYITTGRKFTESEIKEIATSLLKILTYLHGRQPPIIHRDIKPSNIILIPDGNRVGQVYLVDFGSVQTLASKAGKTVTVVGTYGYMPPEQFGGYATPASDLYSLGATLIALATGIHPADLPQKNLRIGFQDAVNLSPALVVWLQWLTEPSLEKRLTSASAALNALKTGQIRTTPQSVVRLDQPVNTLSLFWNAMWRSTVIGGIVVAMSAALYSTVVIPIVGTYMGLQIGAFVGFPIAFVNGFVVAIITRLFFFPLKNSHLHRRTVTIISTILGMSIAVISFKSLSFHETNSLLLDKVFWMIAPSVITGLGMGTASKSIAQWYEKEHHTNS